MKYSAPENASFLLPFYPQDTIARIIEKLELQNPPGLKTMIDQLKSREG